MAEWGKRAWIGFFQYLQSYLGEGNWKYVANKSGGFMGFWAFKHRVNDVDVYLLLEQDKICFKVSVPNENGRSKTRNKFYKLFVAQAPNFDLRVIKPKRFGSGKHMTFAILDTDLFNVDNDGSVDFRKVEALMENLQKYISYTINQYQRQTSQ